MWLTASRYAKAGGRGEVILDVAAWAVPFGLIGTAAGAVAGEGAHLFPSRPGLWSAARAWDGAIGVPGAVGLGALGALIACRRAGLRLGPVAGAAVPGLAVRRGRRLPGRLVQPDRVRAPVRPAVGGADRARVPGAGF